MSKLPGATGAPGQAPISELVDIIAASEHRGPLELYAAAARKVCRDLRRHSELEQALVLAGMMSERFVEFAMRAQEQEPADPVRAFERLLSAEASRSSESRGWAPPAKNRAAVPDESERRAPRGARRVLPDELLAAPCPPPLRSARRSRSVDWHGSWDTAWAAGLALLGAGPAEAGGEPVRFLNGVLTAHAARTPAEVAHAVRREVFTRSAQAPESVFTLALYAHQTMLLHRPEAYALASLAAPAARTLARKVASVDGLLAWMRKHVRDGSIFPEPDRVMLACQVIELGVGRALDRALALFAVLKHKGYGARVIRTTRAVYTMAADADGTVLIDAGWLATTPRPEGFVVLAFDETRQFGYREAWEPPEVPALPETPFASPRQAARKLASVTVA